MTDQQPKRNPQVNENLPPTTPILPSQLTSGRRRPSCETAARGRGGRISSLPPFGRGARVVDAGGVVVCGASPKGRQRGDPPAAALPSSPPVAGLSGARCDLQRRWRVVMSAG